MTFKVRVLSKAVEDVDAIVRWMVVEREEPAGAAAWLAAYQRMLERLTEQADTLPVASESRFSARKIREVLFRTRHGRTYRALFTLDANEAIVLHVRSPGQRSLKRGELRSPNDP